MDIITLVSTYAEELLLAGQKFMEAPERMSDLESTAEDISKRLAADFIAMTLEQADELIRTSLLRKDRYNIQRKVRRSLITTVGDVTYDRTLFKDKETGRYVRLLDEMMQLPEHERFSVLAEAKTLYEAKVHSYQHAADSLSIGQQTISKTAVMEKVHGIEEDLPKEEVLPEDQKKWVDYLYIEADEDHIHQQKNGKENGCMIGKLIYIFEGKRDVCEGRRELVGARYFGGLYAGSEANRKLWEEVQRYIEDHYHTDALKRVYISSDGGGWIKAGKEYIDKSVLVADRFHLMKYIYRVAGYTLDEADLTKQRFYKYIYKDKLLAAKKLLTRIKNSTGHDSVIEETRRYLVNNWDAIQRTFHDKNVLGCSAEGHVSHVYSERMSSRPMGWSKTGCDRMLKLRCYVKNESDRKIIDLVEYRRRKQYHSVAATGTDGLIDVNRHRKYISREERNIRTYIERMQATIPGHTVKKMLAIREHLREI